MRAFFLILNVLSLASQQGSQGAVDSITVSDLFLPLTNFQIILRLPLIPNMSARNDEGTHEAMKEAVNYFQFKGHPTQLSFPYNNFTAPTHFAAGRFIENKIMWFLFLSAEPNIVLHDLLSTCTFPSNRLHEPVSIKHLFNLLIVQTDDSPLQNDFRLDPYVSALQTPLFLMICHLHHATGMIPASSIKIYDV